MRHVNVGDCTHRSIHPCTKTESGKNNHTCWISGWILGKFAKCVIMQHCLTCTTATILRFYIKMPNTELIKSYSCEPIFLFTYLSWNVWNFLSINSFSPLGIRPYLSPDSPRKKKTEYVINQSIFTTRKPHCIYM